MNNESECFTGICKHEKTMYENIHRGGSRGRQTSHATNVKIANLIKVFKYSTNSPVIFYHAATPYNSPVSIIMQR